MMGRKSTNILLFILSTTSVFIAGIMSLMGTDGIIVGMLIAMVVLVYLSQPRRLAMNKP